MNHSLALLVDRIDQIDQILPSGCQFDPVPGLDDDLPWQGNTDEYRAWADRWAHPAWDDLSCGGTEVGARAIPRIPRVVKL